MAYERKNIPELQEGRIDLKDILSRIWVKRKFLVYCALIGALAGLIIAFSIPKEYVSRVVVAPETGVNQGGSVSALASVAGISLSTNSGGDALSYELYPEITSSTPFLVELMDIEVRMKGSDENMSLFEYLTEHQKAPWWGVILSSPFRLISVFKGTDTDSGDGSSIVTNQPFAMSRKQTLVSREIDNRVGIDVDQKTGTVKLYVRMQDPLVAAITADSVSNYLKNYITEYRTNKARKDLTFTQQLFEEAQQEYYSAQQNYAMYADRNQNVVMFSYRTDIERLQNEMNLKFAVYTQTAQQLAVAKAKVQDITPVFTVIEPATVPMKVSSPKKFTILIAYIFLGLIVGIAWIFIKDSGIPDIFKKKKNIDDAK